MPVKKTVVGKPKTEKEFVPTFRKYKSMTPSEQGAFCQGAKTVERKIKVNLGLMEYKEKNKSK